MFVQSENELLINKIESSQSSLNNQENLSFDRIIQNVFHCHIHWSFQHDRHSQANQIDNCQHRKIEFTIDTNFSISLHFVDWNQSQIRKIAHNIEYFVQIIDSIQQEKKQE